MSVDETQGYKPLNTTSLIRTLLRPCLQNVGITYRGPILNDNCVANCSENEEVDGFVCPPSGRLRFVKKMGDPIWSAVESLAAKVLFLAYDSEEYKLSEPQTQIILPSCSNLVRSIV